MMEQRDDEERPVVITAAASEPTFADTLYEWMDRAPWMLLSGAAHLLAFFVLMAIPWQWLSDDHQTVVVCVLAETAPEEFIEEPIEEPEPVLTQDADIEEPELQESEPKFDETKEDMPEGDPQDRALVDVARTPSLDLPPIGFGGNTGGSKYGSRWPSGGGSGRGGRGVPEALKRGLRWLADHQAPDGYWDGDGFMDNNVGGRCACEGDGYPSHDVGLTGLALLAFLGNGNTADSGPYRETVARGVYWLNAQSDADTGLLGSSASAEFLYDHAIATLALSEAYYFSKSPSLRHTVEQAVALIQRARAPYGGWRYQAPSLGDHDTSVTGWMLFALTSAKEAGIDVDRSALVEGLGVIDEFTDPATGRVGYDSPGSLSSRTAANTDGYPREKGEALTAVGLLCRIFLAKESEATPARTALWDQHAKLLAKSPPRFEPGGDGNDMYYWYYGTYAMFQMGGRHWKAWKRSMEAAVLQSQRSDGDSSGSWDPSGPWGYAGGRVYSTALMVLCLEVYFRYGRVLGAR